MYVFSPPASAPFFISNIFPDLHFRMANPLYFCRRTVAKCAAHTAYSVVVYRWKARALESCFHIGDLMTLNSSTM